MKRLFTIWPFVYTNRCEDDVLYYNTISGDSAYFKNNSAIANITEMLEQQDFFCTIDDNLVEELDKYNFFTILMKKNMGYYRKESFPVKPVSWQNIDIYNTDIILNFKNDEYLLENLRDITFYINNYADVPVYANLQTIHKAHKQFLFPVIESSKSELSFDAIQSVLQKIAPNIVNINILGGNIFNHSQIKSLIDLFNQSLHNIYYHFHYTDLTSKMQQQFFSLIDEDAIKIILIDFPFTENDFQKWKKIINKKNILIKFIVESDIQIIEAENIISKFKLEDYHFQPFYNGKNLDFFRSNVFVSEEDILTVKESLFSLMTKKISNPSFFGKLIVNACGEIYTTINQPMVGHLIDLSLEKIIYKLITDEYSVWRKNKCLVTPCNKCIYNLLCPPISNYEYALEQCNLCHVKCSK